MTEPSSSRREAGSLEGRPPPKTTGEVFARSAERYAEKPALLHKQDGIFQPISYAELNRRVQQFALGLSELGIGRGDRVAILSENRPEWAVADLAILSIGAVNVPLYATLPPRQVEFILQDSGARALIVSTGKQSAKLAELQEPLPALTLRIIMDETEPPEENWISFEAVSSRGAAAPDGAARLKELMAAVSPGDECSIIYTSGTTGSPKGAVLTHDNFMSNAHSVIDVVGIDSTHTFLSYLPLSHVFERIAGHYLSLASGATTAYAESIFTVGSNLTEVRPTLMASVPRLFESIQSRVEDAVAKQPPMKQKLAAVALRIGWLHNSRRFSGRMPALPALLLYPLADRLVLKPMRDKIFGGRLQFTISGGAPLPINTGKFMASLGVNILEGYGLTETSPVIAVNLPGKIRLGTVGPPIPGVQVRIAPDGEILTRGPHVMKGYFNRPDDTKDAIDPEGWFHTGDVGQLDDDGYLRITDRKKDIIVLANGKNVAPQPIEARLKESPYIANAVLFGDRQSQVVALVVPNFDALKKWAKDNSLDASSPDELVQKPEVRKLYRAEVERLSVDLADYEKVRRHALLTRDFSAEHDEVTPTLKIRRRQVAENFAAEISSLYRSS